MNILVIIPSRGRPRQLSALLTSLKLSQSEKHQIEYLVACDDDDPDTVAMCESIINDKSIGWKVPLRYSCAPRATSLGKMLNDTAELVPADVYTTLSDDLICATFGWDEVIAKAVEACPFGVFWWMGCCPIESGQAALYAIVTEQWRKAAGGLFTNDYPFWWDDVCLAETWEFVTGKDNVPLPIKVIDKPHKTTRMRDVWFWREFYHFTLPARIRDAYDIAAKLGLPEPTAINEQVKKLKAAIEPMKKHYFDEMEKSQGDSNPPDGRYLEARRRAETIMASMHVPNLNPPEEIKVPLTRDVLLATLKKDPVVLDLLAKLTGQPVVPAHDPAAPSPVRTALPEHPTTGGEKRSRPPSKKPSLRKPRRPS